jgi:hypothetical protein
MQRLITSKEFSDLRRCSERTTQRERERDNGCPYVRIGRRIYYRPEDVEAFISAHVRGSNTVLPAGSRSRSMTRGCTSKQ